MRLPGGDTVDVYNFYIPTPVEADLTNANLRSPTTSSRTSRAAVIVTGDLTRYPTTKALCCNLRSQRLTIRERPHHTAVRAHLHGRQRVSCFDKIFYQRLGVTLPSATATRRRNSSIPRVSHCRIGLFGGGRFPLRRGQRGRTGDSG